ncbi:hypothetical protein LOAG_02811 [Loa loa]|uniref:Uncharacterized protein n=1 Tax=Loa loa TaxID=7209 RepID=A0A1S0U623_LOALO|nr:hypothetical protein LOAG_02811 [Loa loa]EFO25672.1 hypothetical protein LOAG_02811 [Loa loa]
MQNTSAGYKSCIYDLAYCGSSEVRDLPARISLQERLAIIRSRKAHGWKILMQIYMRQQFALARPRHSALRVLVYVLCKLRWNYHDSNIIDIDSTSINLIMTSCVMTVAVHA